MSFLGFMAIMSLIALAWTAMSVAWVQRHEPETITLLNVVVGVIACLVPIVCCIVIIINIIFFFAEIAPKIVVFKGKPDAKQ